MSCRVETCEAVDVAAQGYCETHYRRHLRGGDLAAPKQERLSPRGRALEAALAYADVDSDDDKAHARAEANLAMAVSRWRDPLVLREHARAISAAGNAARTAKLTAERRSEIARIAAQARAAKLDPEARRRIAKAAVQARWRHQRDTCFPREASKRSSRRKAAQRAGGQQAPGEEKP